MRRWISMAQRAAAIGSAKTIRKPSPVALTSKPPLPAMDSRTMWLCSSTMPAQTASPRSSVSCTESSMSVKRTVRGFAPLGEEGGAQCPAVSGTEDRARGGFGAAEGTDGAGAGFVAAAPPREDPVQDARRQGALRASPCRAGHRSLPFRHSFFTREKSAHRAVRGGRVGECQRREAPSERACLPSGASPVSPGFHRGTRGGV